MLPSLTIPLPCILRRGIAVSGNALPTRQRRAASRFAMPENLRPVHTPGLQKTVSRTCGERIEQKPDGQPNGSVPANKAGSILFVTCRVPQPVYDCGKCRARFATIKSNMCIKSGAFLKFPGMRPLPAAASTTAAKPGARIGGGQPHGPATPQTEHAQGMHGKLCLKWHCGNFGTALRG